MPINFPDSPSLNDTHTVLGKTWVWNGTYWKLSGSSNRGISLQVSDTAPSDPVAGDMWYESDTGRTFTYYDGAWIELGNTASVTAFLADTDADTLVHVEESADSDTIAFTTGGTKRLEIDASGHVIPAANETYDLGSASNRFRDLYLSGTSINLGGAEISSDGTNLTMPPISNISGDFTVDTNTLHVDSTNDRVGIGTSTPSAPLEISTSVNTEALRLSANFTAGNQETYITAVDTGDSSILAAIGLGSTGGSNDNDGAITFRTTTASSSSIPGTVMIINKDGNVGVGTTSPAENLDVTGSASDVSLLLRSGDINTGANNGKQIVLGYSGTASYAHNIRTRHNDSADIGNAIDFYLWDQGTNPSTTYGTKLAMSIDGGYVLTPNQPMFSAYLNSGPGVPTGPTTIVADDIATNVGGHYSTSTGRFTAPVDGHYYFSFNAFYQVGTTFPVNYSFRVNGVLTSYRSYENNSESSYGATSGLTALFTLSAGDYVETYLTSGELHSNDALMFSGFLVG